MILADARARRRIEFRRKKNVFVEAGAGTGKTTALVRRIANLVCAGSRPVRMREIVATTFTEDAAAEIKERLRTELERRARQATDAGKDSTSILIALREIDQASIQTIHGFARSILARHPLEAGLPPGFRVLDEIDSSIRFDDWWSALLDEMLGDDSLALSWDHAIDAKITPARLKSFAAELKRLGARLPAETWSEVSQASIEALLSEAEASVAALLTECTDAADKLYALVVPMDSWIKQARVLTSSLGLYRHIDAVPKKPRSEGKNAGWPRGGTECRNEAKAVWARMRELQDQLRFGLISPLLNRIRSAIQCDAEERRRSGTIEFQDLLDLVARLLRDNAAIKAEAHLRYRRIHIDEAQDTDPVQLEIMALIAAENAGEPEFEWTRARIQPGRLFIVGDPKQSIYRFRAADVRAFEQAKQVLADVSVTLDTNFRSTPEVIEFVNAVFGRLLDAEGQADYVPLCASPAFGAHPDGVVLRTLGGTCSGPESTVSVMRQREAEDVARLAGCAVLGSEQAPWKVRHGDGFRPARFRDITMLFPKRTVLARVERELDRAGIPFRVDSRSLLFETQLVRDLLHLLQAIEDPSDEVALLATLRSPCFGCSDADLLDFGGPWTYLDAPPGSPPLLVKEALEALSRYHGVRGRLRVAELLELVVSERRLMELAVAQRRPRDHWRRIKLLTGYARDFDTAEGGTLRSFLTWARTLADKDARVKEAVVPEADDDAVSLTTIHASKGMEYPIVFLIGLSSHHGRPEPVRLVLDSGALHARLGATPRVESPGAATAIQADRDLDRLEQDRLLYVAATRAKDHLVVSCYHNPKASSPSMAARLHAAMSEQDRTPCEIGVPRMAEREAPERQVLPARDGWIKTHQAVIKHALSRPSRAPTTIAKEVAQWLGGVASEPAAAAPHGGADLGRAVHMVLQTIDLGASIGGAEGVIAALARAERQRIESVRELVSRALQSDPVREAASVEHWREIFLSAYVEGVLIEGYVDLVYRRRDGEYVVVDYKTDAAFTDAQVRSRMETYRFQAAAYALAFEQTVGKRPASVKFLFLNHVEPRGFEVDDLDDVSSTVRLYLRQLDRAREAGDDDEWRFNE